MTQGVNSLDAGGQASEANSGRGGSTAKFRFNQFASGGVPGSHREALLSQKMRPRNKMVVIIYIHIDKMRLFAPLPDAVSKMHKKIVEMRTKGREIRIICTNFKK